MKKLFTLFVAVLFTSIIFAQAPEKMSYQAVIRDAGNVLVSNQSVGMQISVLQTTANGTAVYVETQTPTTNANGLVSIEIGMGNVVSGDFSAIDWSAGPYFIKTETDPTGGTSYTITGTSELLSVPYALYSKNVEAGVYSIIEGTTDYQFIPDNQWRQFAELTTSITLSKTSDVLISYNATSSSPGTGYLATRILINDSETHKMFRSTFGYNNRIYSNGASGIVSLTAGTHTITVQYRTNMPQYPQNNAAASSDYMGRGLTVKQLK